MTGKNQFENTCESFKRYQEEGAIERWKNYCKDSVETSLKVNSISLSVGYVFLFTALSWLNGKIPYSPFFGAATSLLTSIAFFFAWLFIFMIDRTFSEHKIAQMVDQIQDIGKLNELIIDVQSRALKRSQKIWHWCFLFALFAAVCAGVIIFFYSLKITFSGIPNDPLIELQRENASLQIQLDQTLQILQHERLMHFGEVSGDKTKR